ncbi:MAG: DNA repair protein, partial [Candidatus Eisenbacteria bacterium]|nr:DNA repair protein [Candidatus Eisenbacteria bacterium]
PSGDPEPSEEDISITKRLVEVGDLLGIGVLDHVVVGSRGVVSFRSRQLL